MRGCKSCAPSARNSHLRARCSIACRQTCACVCTQKIMKFLACNACTHALHLPTVVARRAEHHKQSIRSSAWTSPRAPLRALHCFGIRRGWSPLTRPDGEAPLPQNSWRSSDVDCATTASARASRLAGNLAARRRGVDHGVLGPTNGVQGLNTPQTRRAEVAGSIPGAVTKEAR